MMVASVQKICCRSNFPFAEIYAREEKLNGQIWWPSNLLGRTNEDFINSFLVGILSSIYAV